MSFDMWAECLRDTGGGCQRREGGPIWYWQNNANENFALFIVAGPQELHLTQTCLSPEESCFLFFFIFPPSLAFSQIQMLLLLLMKVWITKISNANQSPGMVTSKHMLHHCNFTRLDKTLNTILPEGWKNTFFRAETQKKWVFVYLVVRQCCPACWTAAKCSMDDSRAARCIW